MLEAKFYDSAEETIRDVMEQEGFTFREYMLRAVATYNWVTTVERNGFTVQAYGRAMTVAYEPDFKKNQEMKNENG